MRTEECEILPCIAENSKKGEPILSKIVYVRFASSSSIFKPNTKIYPYEIIDDELFNKLQIGSIIKIKKLSDNSYLTDVFDYSPSYRDTEIRVEGKVTVSKEDIPFIIDKKEWKIIKDIFYIRDSIDKKWITDFIQKQKEFIPVYAESSLTYSIGDSCITYTDIEREYIKETSSLPAGDLRTLLSLSAKDLRTLEESCLSGAQEITPFSISGSSPSFNLCSDNTCCSNNITAATDSSPTKEFVDKLEEGLKPYGIPLRDETGRFRPIYDIFTDIAFELSSMNEDSSIEEDNNMSEIFNNIFNDVDFGKLTTNSIKYSINGIAFADKNNKFFVYKDNRAIDVTGMTIEVPMFAMPVAVNQIQPNDVVRFKDDYVIVKELTDDGVKVINPIGGDIKVIVPQVNVFGFNYMTKVINPFESFANTANETNPFGNIMPLMMFGDINKGNDDIFKIMMMSQMCGGNSNINQMLPFMLISKDDKNNDFLTMMLMSQMNGNNIFNFNGTAAQENKKNEG